MRKIGSVDVLTYLRAFPLLARHLSILAVPLLAAVVDVLFDRLSTLFTDPLGGSGAGIFQMLSQLVYLWAFGVAIVQAGNVWRGRRGSFDDAWDESRAKFGGIALAAIGFQFVVWAASFLGSFLGGIVGLALGAVAAFFLIYTIPAAAIGGMPGSLALAASFRAVRENVLGSIVLAVVFFAVYYAAVPLALPFLLIHLPPLGGQLVMAVARALALSYLAFPFAKQYDDVAFKRSW
ncbi:MAG TPA: hypothetical protein VGF98_15520 [Candidatus Tumulicola sp.]